MNRVRLKVCCISSQQEADLAIAAGADAIGLVGPMPSGPGIIDDDLARTIAAAVPANVETFLLTSRQHGADIADHVAYCGTSTVQVVRHIDPAEYAIIAKRLPSVRRVQVIHVEDNSALDYLPIYEPWVHAFLLDSGRPTAASVELGGTGRAHDWQISTEFVARSNKPVFLAGGLNPANVRGAVAQVQPFGVDLCSGVRVAQRLDRARLSAFAEALWATKTGSNAGGSA